MTKHDGLTILCNGCGEPMRSLGEWPVVFPKPTNGGTAMNVQQATRYSCGTCRTPHPHYEKGIPVLISILEVP